MPMAPATIARNTSRSNGVSSSVSSGTSIHSAPRMTGVITGRAGYRESVHPLQVRRRFQLEGGAVVADHRNACLRRPTISTPLG